MELPDYSAYGQPNYMEQVDFGTSEDELSCNETVYFEEFEGEPRSSTPIIVDSDVEVPKTPSTIQPDEENDVFIDLPSHAKKGGNLVAEVTGYVYSHKRSNIWTCTVRTKEVRCYAATKMVDGKYQKLGHHKCEARPGIVKKKRIAFESKKLAKSQPFKSTNAIIDDVLLDLADETPSGALAKKDSIRRCVSRVRQENRPKHPFDLTFKLELDHVPSNFLRGDIRSGDRRHLLFATENQKSHLKNAKTWFINATFKVVKEPFKQLFSIHTFVTNSASQERQHVPISFAIMSGRSMNDYKSVLQEQLDVAGRCKVEEVVCDFEVALWKAIQSVFPQTSIRAVISIRLKRFLSTSLIMDLKMRTLLLKRSAHSSGRYCLYRCFPVN